MFDNLFAANEWTEWYNPPDYERQAYRDRRRNTEFEQSVIDCGNLPETHPNCSHGCLFDIEADPCEYQDLSQAHNEVFDRLKEKLNSFRNEMIEPRYKHDADPNSNPRNHGGIWTPWVEESGDPVTHKPLPAGAELPGRPAATTQQQQNAPMQQRFTAPETKKQHEVRFSGSSKNEHLEPLVWIFQVFINHVLSSMSYFIFRYRRWSPFHLHHLLPLLV